MRLLFAVIAIPALAFAADTSAGRCPAPKPFAPGPGAWNGWSVDDSNSRFQQRPRLAAADAPELKLKWAFGFPGETRTQSQPDGK